MNGRPDLDFELTHLTLLGEASPHSWDFPAQSRGGLPAHKWLAAPLTRGRTTFDLIPIQYKGYVGQPEK